MKAAKHPPLSLVLAPEATRTFLGLALYLTVINRSLNEQGMGREGNELAHALEVMAGTHQAAHIKWSTRR